MNEKVELPPTEKVFIALPSGIIVGLESTQKDLNQMNETAIATVNSILEFSNDLKNKTKRSYLG